MTGTCEVSWNEMCIKRPQNKPANSRHLTFSLCQEKTFSHMYHILYRIFMELLLSPLLCRKLVQQEECLRAERLRNLLHLVLFRGDFLQTNLLQDMALAETSWTAGGLISDLHKQVYLLIHSFVWAWQVLSLTLTSLNNSRMWWFVMTNQLPSDTGCDHPSHPF